VLNIKTLTKNKTAYLVQKKNSGLLILKRKMIDFSYMVLQTYENLELKNQILKFLFQNTIEEKIRPFS